MSDGVEIPLRGGMVSTVVRVGDTVRRPVERWSHAVHGVLDHLEAVGFAGAPAFLGIDDQDREILSWIPGTPAARPWPDALLRDEGLISLGRLLRSYHDAVAGYEPPAETEWWTGIRPRRKGEVICHGDVGPWNTIWRGDEAIAFIDWDFVEPGPAVRDLAELAFFAVPMRDDEHCRECGFLELPDRAHRLQVLCAAYGRDDLEAIVDAAEGLWEDDIARIATLGPKGITPWDGFLERGLVDANQALLDWLRANRRLLTAR